MRFVFAVCLADAAPMRDKRRSRTREVPPQAEWRRDAKGGIKLDWVKTHDLPVISTR